MAKQLNDNFLIALNGIKLTDAQKQKINSGIQEVVMRELAHTDSEIVVKRKKSLVPTSIKDLPFIWGFWIDDLNGKITINQHTH
jgi:hypothetical protein